MKVIALIVASLAALASAQRGHYAGSRPINDGLKGPFPDAQGSQTLGNRFSDSSIANGATQPANSNTNVVPNPNQIPQYNPYNNVHLFNYINQQPPYQQPFWYLNNEAIQAQLNGQQQQMGVQPLANRGSFFNGKRRR